MKKTLKKFAASVMAVTTLAVSMTGLTTNAAGGSVTFSPAATASIYVNSTQINIGTVRTGAVEVRVRLIGSDGASASGDSKDKYGYDGSVYGNYTGNGFTGAHSRHNAKTNTQSGQTDMDAYC